MTQDEALKLSQEALAGLKDVEKQVRELIAENKALKEALAQTERPAPCARHCEANAFQIVIKNLKAQLAQTQEPVAWMKDCADFWDYYICLNETAQEKYDQEAQIWIKTLRTATPQRTWVNLTYEQVAEIYNKHGRPPPVNMFMIIDIENKIQEINT